jgi:membrane-associated phospholipid phosphatase
MTALLLVTLLAASPQASAPQPLSFSMSEDLAITAAAAAIWGGEVLLAGALGPETCRWCDRHPDGSDALNGLDRWGTHHLIWGDRGAATAASNTVVVALPLGLAGLDWVLAHQGGKDREALEDLVMIAEATAISGALNGGEKYAFGRQRPYAHLAGITGPSEVEDNVSFYSGHSAFAFSLASAAGTIASLRGYRHAWVVWAVGMPVAGTVAYFRLAAAKHYLTDVLVGTLVGGAIGAGVPLLFHRRIGGARVQLVPGPGSVSLVGVF